MKVKLNKTLLKLSLSLKHEKRGNGEPAIGESHTKQCPAPRPDYRMTLIGECSKCGAQESTVYNGIWDATASKVLYQLLDVLPQDAKMFFHTLKADECDKCKKEVMLDESC